MDESDKRGAMVGIAKLAAVFLHSRIDDLGLLAYWDGIKNKIGSLAVFDLAVQIALEECERMPPPIELTRLARRAMRESVKALPPMSGDEKKRILESWKQEKK